MDGNKLKKFEEYEYMEQALLNLDRRHRRNQQKRQLTRDVTQARTQFTDFSDNILDFVPTYAAALDPLHHERQWLIRSVGSFYRDNLITDVTRIVKGGKEANVYCCLANPASGVNLIAAKLYRPRMLRHLRNDALYKEGRILLDHEGKLLKGSREARAMAKRKSRFGKDLGFLNWIGHEFQVLTELYQLGADVPRPIAYNNNTILMEFVGDEWAPAPALNEVKLPEDQASGLLHRVLDNIRLMLTHHYIHGDLSAYNILYWEGSVTIIDFPQVVDARKNPSAQMLLQRDIQRVCEYFEGHGVESDPIDLFMQLWSDYQDGRL